MTFLYVDSISNFIYTKKNAFPALRSAKRFTVKNKELKKDGPHTHEIMTVVIKGTEDADKDTAFDKPGGSDCVSFSKR